MERKNTVLLTVIAVATLLVAVVGATFAYFTATTSTNNDFTGTQAGGTTLSSSGTKLLLASSTNHSELEYPGGFAFAGASAQAIKTQDGDDDNYNIGFDLTLSVSNGTSTQLNWKLYKTTTEIEITPANTKYCQLQGESSMELSYNCTYSSLFNGLTPVKSGTIAANGSALLDSEGKEITAHRDSLKTTGKNTGEQAFYYLVVDYPNDPTKDQGTTDQGTTIQASITGAQNLVATVATAGE